MFRVSWTLELTPGTEMKLSQDLAKPNTGNEYVLPTGCKIYTQTHQQVLPRQESTLFSFFPSPTQHMILLYVPASQTDTIPLSLRI